jgi:hypothetical protein
MSDEAVGAYPGGRSPRECSQECSQTRGDRKGPEGTRGDEPGLRRVQAGTIRDEKGQSGTESVELITQRSSVRVRPPQLHFEYGNRVFPARIARRRQAECSRSVSGTVGSYGRSTTRRCAPRGPPTGDLLVDASSLRSPGLALGVRARWTRTSAGSRPKGPADDESSPRLALCPSLVPAAPGWFALARRHPGGAAGPGDRWCACPSRR